LGIGMSTGHLLTGQREVNYFYRGVTTNTKARTLNMRKLN